MTAPAQIDWTAAIHYAKLVRLAETVLPTHDDKELVRQLTPLGYRYLETLYGNDLATDHDPHIGQVDSFGYLCLSPVGELVATIRGTDTMEEWMHDFEFLRVRCSIFNSIGESEDGFTAFYQSLRIGADASAKTVIAAIQQQLTSGAAASVAVTGHSLGGALATLLTLDVALNSACTNPTSYTYASPMVGDSEFAKAYDAAVPSTFRVVNRHDLVPKLPGGFPLSYQHVETGFEVTPPLGKVKSSIGCMHHLTTYLWLMGQAAQQSTGTLDPGCAN